MKPVSIDGRPGGRPLVYTLLGRASTGVRMSDVFISYASEDHPQAELLAKALAACGWEIWWDRTIEFGEDYRAVITRELNRAKCVVVMWSQHAVESKWVCGEAEDAAVRNVLIPVRIDDVRLPPDFRQLQTGDLTGWHGDQNDPVFLKLVQRIAKFAGRAGAPGQPEPDRHDEPERPPPPPPSPPRPHGRWLRYGIPAGILALIVAVYGVYLWYQTPAQIVSFTCSQPAISSGQSVTLAWRVRNAGGVWLQPRPGYVGDSDGSLVVTPSAEEGEMEYKLWAEGRAGPSKSAENTITVRVLSKSRLVTEAKTVAVEWYRAYLHHEDQPVVALAGEPFYFFDTRLAGREDLGFALNAANRPPGRQTAPAEVGSRGVWTFERFRTDPPSLRMSPERVAEVLGNLEALPDDYIVLLQSVPTGARPIEGPQEIGLAMSKRSGRWLILGVFDLSPKRAVRKRVGPAPR